MFTPGGRAQLRDALVARARTDSAIVGAALVGSAATGREDDWSDIDLALQVAATEAPTAVAERWTADMYAERGAADHLDVVAGGVLYRVFLLDSSLQVDISFWPEAEFRATEPGFALLFGKPAAPTDPASGNTSAAVGWAWLYALHARSAIARGRTWQAVMMLDQLRDQILVLATLRHGVESYQGRGLHHLPESELAAVSAARAGFVESGELARSLRSLLDLLVSEVSLVEPDVARKLTPPFAALAASLPTPEN